MSLIVQKFGGSSLADPERVRRCARRAADAHAAGHRVLVVVSAMGHTTDELITLAGRVAGRPPQRELDILLSAGEQMSAALMAMAVQDLGVPAVSLTSRNLGIVTDPVHCNAKIRSIDAAQIERGFEAGTVVVAPGFQGVTPDGHITTLGRGGSDTTAVAIAAALGVGRECAGGGGDGAGDGGGGGSADAGGVCEIYTDVDGVYTADPRRVARARKLARISYEEMVELASLGAGVLHTRSVMFGQRFAVPIHVRSSTSFEEGTMIVNETPDMERVSVVGCALTPDLGRITIRGLPNRPGVQSVIFGHIERAGILVDDIVQIETGETADVSFTVEGPGLADLKVAVQAALETVGAGEMSVDVGLSKVSAVGVGMRTHTGVAATMFQALGEAEINIANITTSEIKISCIVPMEHADRALQVVHDAFGLGEPAAALDVVVKPAAPAARTTARR